MKSSTYFHINAKVLSDFQICISIPLMELRAHIHFLERKVYFLPEELIEKSFLLRSLITAKQNANIVQHYHSSTLPLTPEKFASSSPISKRPSNKSINFHIDNGRKSEHLSEVNKIKKVFLTTDNNQINPFHTTDLF